VSLKHVKDHVDVISSEMFNTMLSRFADLLRWTNAAPNILAALTSLPRVQPGRPVRPSLVNVMVDACHALCDFFRIEKPPGLHKVAAGMWVHDSDVNPLVDCINACMQAFYGKADIYLFNAGDWGAARSYVADNSIIITTWSPPVLNSSEVLDVLDKYRAVFVIEVDTEPYRGIANQAYYQVLYTVPAPTWCYTDYAEVLEDSFRRFLGSKATGVFDYMVDSSLKVPDAVLWARYPYAMTCGWSYVKRGRGAVIEVPCDGFWRNVGVLASYIDALRYTFLDPLSRVRILHLGHYVSDMPGAHVCYPADVCWQQLAEQRGWQLHDLRR
jgi:hypothetical protein